MKAKTLRFGRGFRVAFSNRRAQAAEMVIEPGGSEGGKGNRHRGADQWMFVVAGTGVAIVGGKRIRLRRGSLIAIERGDEHEVRNTGRSLLKTVNVYVPPAYAEDGSELSRGRPH